MLTISSTSKVDKLDKLAGQSETVWHASFESDRLRWLTIYLPLGKLEHVILFTL
jgi:hypothetical protein